VGAERPGRSTCAQAGKTQSELTGRAAQVAAVGTSARPKQRAAATRRQHERARARIGLLSSPRAARRTVPHRAPPALTGAPTFYDFLRISLYSEFALICRFPAVIGLAPAFIEGKFWRERLNRRRNSPT